MAIVSLEQAKKHLKVFHSFEDEAIAEYAAMAEAVVLDYIKRPYDPATDDDDLVLRVACLRMLAHLWDVRGSDDTKAPDAKGYLPENVTMFLHRKRKPAMA